MDKKVPEIRFKGFSGDWDKKILGELVQLKNGFAFQSKYFKKNPTEVIVLTPGSVNIGGGFQAGKGQYYDVKQDVSPKYVFKPDDLFITMTDLTPTAQALGFPAIIPRDNNTYLHNQRLGKLVGFKGDLGFLYSLLCTQKKQKEVVSTSSGTTVKHTSPDKFLNRFCFFPKKEEQTQIGNTFQKLDSLINQHQQKHDKLSSIKKAMLEKMFPKQGETTPEIRFKGFKEEWEEKELTNEVELFSGLTYSPKDIRKEGTFVIRSSNVKKGQLVQADNVYVNSEVVNCNNVIKGDVIVVVRNGSRSLIGKHAQVTSCMDNTVIGAFMTGIRSKQPEFINALLDTNQFTAEVDKNLGATINQITNGAFNNMVFMFPAKDEQRKIGKYFSKFDCLIYQHQQQITKLNNIKQACLNKMFV